MNSNPVPTRYPGLSSFTTEQKNIFFGRNQETRDLFNLISVERTVVLFSKSGYGKTSLLQAGVIPLLYGQQLVPVPIRFGTDALKPEQHFSIQFEAAYKRFFGKDDQKAFDFSSKETFWEQINRCPFGEQPARFIPLIIFDQFEELFTLYPDRQDRERFIHELADLIQERLPEKLRIDLAEGFQRGEISDSQAAALESAPPMKFIFSIRSDMLHFMDELSEEIPYILRSRYQLFGLKEKQAAEAIINPAGLPGNFASPPFRFEDAAIKEILTVLAKNRELESFQLQAVCQAIEEKLIARQDQNPGLLIVTSEFYGGREGIESILEESYKSRIESLATINKTWPEIARRLLEDSLVNKNDRRQSVDVVGLLGNQGATSSLLGELERMRLVRKEPRLDSFYYEISHDTWLKPILKSRMARVEEEERLAAEEREREFDAKLAEERRRVEEITLISIRHYADDLAYKSQIALKEGDRTAAFRLAELAHRFVDRDNHKVTRALVDALYWNENPSHSPLLWASNFIGHTAGIMSIAFSPDGMSLATGSSDRTVKIWDIKSGQISHTLMGHKDVVRGVSFSPDGRRLASCSIDQEVKIWDLDEGKSLQTLNGYSNSVFCVSFSPDGRQLATGYFDQIAILWDLDTGKAIQKFIGHTDWILSVAFSPDGQRLATCSNDKTARIWNVEKGEIIQTLEGHNDFVLGVAYSPDGQNIATGSGDRTVKIWDTETGEAIQTLIGHTASVRCVAYSPKGKELASGSSDRMVKIWDLESGKVQSLSGHTADVRSVSFSSDGLQLASGSSDQTAKIWGLEKGKAIQTLDGHSDSVLGVQFSPDGKFVVTGSWDGTVKIWNLESTKPILVIEENPSAQDNKSVVIRSKRIFSVAFSPDGKQLATGSNDQIAKIWDIKTGQRIQTLIGHSAEAFKTPFSLSSMKITTGSSGIFSVAFSPDGRLLATGSSDQTARIWDLSIGKEILTLGGHTKGVYSVAFSPDGRRLATASNDQTAKIWDLEAGNNSMILNRHTSGVNCVAFSPDGMRLATASNDHSVKIWDLDRGSELLTLIGHTSWVLSVTFSPDGRLLATGSSDQTARIWDLDSGKELITLKGHNSRVENVAFSPDGSRLVTGSLDQSAKIWELTPEGWWGSIGKNYRLAGLTLSQLESYDLENLLEARPHNEQILLQTKDTWQIAAFADLYSQKIERTGLPRSEDFARAQRLYQACLDSGENNSYFREKLERLEKMWKEKTG